MSELNRKDFLHSLALGGGSMLVTSPGVLAQATSPAMDTPAGGKEVKLASDKFELVLSAGNGLNAKLTHLPSKIVWADGPYSYTFGSPTFTVTASDATSATLTGTMDNGLVIEHKYRVPAGSPWIEEELTLRNPTSGLMRGMFRCGLVMPVKSDTLTGYTFTAVPFRREFRSPWISDFSLDEIMTQTRRTNLREDTSPLHLHEDYFSEGWTATNGTTGFLITKYNQSAREFAILDAVPGPGLRWGGGGRFLGDCEGGLQIPAGGSHSFGVTRLTAFDGDMTQGFYTFRSEMESRGMGVPPGFNPPVHWNELYDNKLWWLTTDGGQDNPDNRKKYYTLDDMKAEAAKAKAIGCEALYCDPGWDTNFASKIWDEQRLGKLTDFVAMLKNDYGLKHSLHTPLSGWCNPSTYPPECFKLHKDGGRGGLCGASNQYVDDTVKRLNVLAEAGVTYFMFDGTAYNATEDCWDPKHGHVLPATASAHVDATNRLACKVHESHPDVSIEMHDQVMGGAPYRYVPLYYGYGPYTSGPRGFDTIWAFEMMWDPLGNLRSGASRTLYYYSLAYSLPLYLHIDLRSDTDQAIVFWWNASTCRYLGIGGTHTDQKVNDAHFAAMKDYKRLKPFFTAGTFYGISELIHVHRHPTDNAAVVNVFGVDGPIANFHFDPAKFGLKPEKPYKFTGGDATKAGDGYDVKLTTPVPAMGHQLVEVSEA
jgi:hypothetical protein